MLEVLESLEHRRERARADLAVESLGEGLEVDVGGVHVPVELGPRFGTDLARGDGHRLDALLAARLRHVDRVFVEDDRVVVRERDAPAAKLPGGRGDEPPGWPRRPGCPVSRDLEMSQFWQNLQPRLHPAVPNESTGVPGKKWASGFFSIGSTQNPLDRP